MIVVSFINDNQRGRVAPLDDAAWLRSDQWVERPEKTFPFKPLSAQHP
jgi:hypothetical protein